MSTIAQIVDAARGFAGVAGMTNASREPVWLADFTLTKKSDSSTVTVGACMGTPIWNGSGAPSGVQYRAGLIVPAVTQTVLSQGEPAFSATLTHGVLSLINTDGYWSGLTAGQTIDFLDSTLYEWQTFTLLLGVQPDAYGDFNQIGVWRLEGRAKINHPFVDLVPRGAMLDMSKPAYDAKYPGFGHALYSDNGDLHVTAGNSDQNVAAAEDAYWRLRFKMADHGAATDVLWANRNAVTGSSAGFTMYVAAGLLRFRIADGTDDILVSDTTVIDDDAWHDVQVWLRRSDDTLNALVDGVAFATDAADASSIDAVTTTSAARLLELTGGGSAFADCHVDEMVFKTGSAITDLSGFADILKQHREGPASIREVGGQYYWSFEGDGGTNEPNGYDAKLGAAVSVPKSHAVTGSTSTREIGYGDNYDKDASSDADSFTFMIWARPTASGANNVLVTKKGGGGAGLPGWWMYITAAGHLLGGVADGSAEVNASAALPGSFLLWRCWALVVDASAAVREVQVWYSDTSGTVWTQVNSAALSTMGDTANALNLTVGELPGGSFWTGDIGTHAIYAEALTAAQMARLAPIIPTKADNANLQSCWPVDEGTGFTITDSVGSINGTMGAGGSWVTRDGTITPGTATNGGWVSSLTGGFVSVNQLEPCGGLSKPQGYGYIVRAPVFWLDNADHAYPSQANAIVGQFHDGPDALEPISSTVDVLVEVGGVAATVGAANDYTVDLTAGTITYNVGGGYPSREVTVTHKGPKFNGGAYSDRTGLMLREILTTNSHLTTGQMPAASATELDAEFPYPSSIYIAGGRDTPESIEQVLRKALPGRVLYGATNLEGDTYLLVRALTNPDDQTADITLTDPVLAAIPSEIDPPKPAYSVAVGYAQKQVTFDSSDGYSYATATSSTVAQADGRAIVIKTGLQNHADALALAQSTLTALTDPLVMEAKINRHFWEAHIAKASGARPSVVSLQSDFASVVSSAVKFNVAGVAYTPPRASSDWEIVLQLFRPST